MFKIIELLSEDEIMVAADNIYEIHPCRTLEYLPKYLVNGNILYTIEDMLSDHLPINDDGTMKSHRMIPAERAIEVLESDFDFIKQILDDMGRPIYSVLGQLYLTATDVRACSGVIPESV